MPRYSLQNNRSHLLAAAFAALASISLFSIQAEAASYTYSRTASNTVGTPDQWSAGTNWSLTPVSGTDTALSFNGVLPSTATIFTNNNIAGDFKLNQLSFIPSGPATGTAPTYAISGNRLEFISNGVTTPVLNIAATGVQSPVLTVSNDLLLTNNLSIAQSSTATLSGVISGGGSLTKTLGGVLTLSNANTYSGGTTLSAGTIGAGSDSALSTGAIMLSGGTLTNATGALVTLNNNLIVASGATSNVRATITGGTQGLNGLTLTGAVTGGGVLQSGGVAASNADATAFKGDFSQFTGTLNPLSVTNAGNTSIGGTTAASFNLGQAVLDEGGVAGANRRLTLQPGLLQVGALQGTGAIAGVSSIQVGALNTNTTYSGNFASTGMGLIKVGTGTLTLNSSVNWAGFNTNALSVNGGMVIEDLANTVTGTGFLVGPIRVGGGTFSLLGKSGTNGLQTFSSLLVNAGASTITASHSGAGILLQLAAITRNVGGTLDFVSPSGVLSGTNGITTTTANNAAGILGGYATVGGTDWAVSGGSATAPITAFASYTGMVAAGGSTTTNYSVAGAGTNLSGAVTINSLKITDTAASQSLSLAGNNLTFTNALGGLLYAGGTSNAYTIFGGNGVDGTGIIGGGTAAGNEFIVNVKAGATLTITAPIIKTGAASTGFLTTSGGGTLILNSITASTFTGTNYLNAGTVEIARDANLGTGALAMNGSTLRLASGGTYGAGALFSNNRNLVLGNNGGTIDTNGSSVTFGGTISGGVVNTTSANTAGGFSLTKAGSGTLALTNANNTYGGATIITGGVLSVAAINVTQGENGGVASSIGASPNTAPYLILNGGTLQYTGGAATTDRHFTLGASGGGIDASGSGGTALNWAGNTGSGGSAINAVAFAGNGARTFTLSGNNTGANTFAMILGNGTGGATSLTKSGTGKWVLTARNTYTGATTVNAGTLLINGDQSAATGNLSVASGAILGGSGTIGGATTVNGIIAPGNSIGTLTIANDVTWNGGLAPGGATDWKFELGAVSGSSDLLSLSGDDFLKGTGSAFRFDFQGTGVAGTFTLVDYATTTFSASDFSYTGLAGSLSGSFVLNGSQLDFVVVPEPSTVLLSALGLVVVLNRIRRRRATISSR